MSHRDLDKEIEDMKRESRQERRKNRLGTLKESKNSEHIMNNESSESGSESESKSENEYSPQLSFSQKPDDTKPQTSINRSTSPIRSSLTPAQPAQKDDSVSIKNGNEISDDKLHTKPEETPLNALSRSLEFAKVTHTPSSSSERSAKLKQDPNFSSEGIELGDFSAKTQKISDEGAKSHTQAWEFTKVCDLEWLMIISSLFSFSLLKRK